MSINHQGTKVLTTDRLILRPLTVDDAQSVFDNWASDDEVTKYLTWTTHQSVDDSIAYLTMCVDGYNAHRLLPMGYSTQRHGRANRQYCRCQYRGRDTSGGTRLGAWQSVVGGVA